MEIVLQKTDEVNANIRLKLLKADYQPNVDKKVKEFAKKAEIKGFRPGKVPVPIVQKMFGKDIKMQEVNDLAKDSLFNYLKENNVEILASPLISLDTMADNKFDWRNEDFEFIYEVGLKPEIKVNLSNIEIPFYTINVGEEEIAALMTRLRDINADFTPYEEVAEGHTVFGLLKYGQDTSRFAHIKLEEATATAKAALIGKKKGETVTIEVKNIFATVEKLAEVLRISKEEAEKLDVTGELTIRESFVAIPADLNETFYNKIFGEGVVATEEDFKNKLKGVLEKKYAIEATGVAITYFRNQVLKENNFDLPAVFLKKWLMSTAEKPIQNIDAEYGMMEEALKYDLLLSQVAKDFNVATPSNEDIVKKVEDTYFLEFFYSRPMFIEGLTSFFAYQFLQSKENENMIQSLRAAIIAERVLAAAKAQIKANDLTVSGGEFEKKELMKVEETVEA
ncbi:MAG: trigger factor [Thermoflexibacteraceae bacterium]